LTSGYVEKSFTASDEDLKKSISIQGVILTQTAFMFLRLRFAIMILTEIMKNFHCRHLKNLKSFL
jgi:hypothetical protein